MNERTGPLQSGGKREMMKMRRQYLVLSLTFVRRPTSRIRD